MSTTITSAPKPVARMPRSHFYYAIDLLEGRVADGSKVYTARELDNPIDRRNAAIGNYYHTKEVAKEDLDILLRAPENSPLRQFESPCLS